MDRRAFMALLCLGPAFKRLVPATMSPIIRLYQPTERMKQFHTSDAPVRLTRPMFDSFLRECSVGKPPFPFWFTHHKNLAHDRAMMPSCVEVLPYAALPEETT